ncbi:MAG TPA: helix-turn-helix transcriptional regulator [Gemmataceae bacterium]|nr:helix-turn-helix transcriptional regulator [Gemmataceae bacterium]
MRFNERLRSLRQERGLTLYRLAQLSGLTRPAITALEQPTSNPTLDTLNKLAKALEVPVEELVRGETEKPKRRPAKRGFAKDI